MEIKGRLIISTAILLVIMAVTSIIALVVGTADVGFFELIDVIFSPEKVSPETRAIILGLRLPRLLMGLLTGGALALSGVVFQALIRNPLADPFILGVSSGAALGAIVASITGLGAFFWGQKFLSFIGAMTTVIIVFKVARLKERLYPNTMLLTGVIINAFFSAAIMFLVSISRSDRIHSIFFWLMGDLSVSMMNEVYVISVVSLVAMVIVFYFARPMNLLLGGEETAMTLGVNVERVKGILFVLASVLTSVVVSAVGVVGFVGLIIPHMMRMVLGPDHRVLIPASVLFGASFLVLADTAARTVVSPMELPVGVVTALLGGPFFIYLLRREMWA